MNHDEQEEPDEHREVQRPGRLNAEDLADALEPGRQRWRHAEAGDERERSGYEHGDEVSELLQTVVGDPPVLGRPVERQVLDQDRAGMREDVPGGGHDPSPLSGGERQDVEDQTVDRPQHVVPRCHHRASPMECLNPGSPT